MYKIGHLEVTSPFGNAGGVVKTHPEAIMMAHTGVGWVEKGSHCLIDREGNGPNGEQTWFYDEETGEMFNSLGMPGSGMNFVEKETAKTTQRVNQLGKALVLNVAPVSDDPAAESYELVERGLRAGPNAVLLNAGCPNVIKDNGKRKEVLSHNPSALELTLNGLRSLIDQYGQRIFIRTSPMETKEQATEIMGIIRLSGVVGVVFTPNTWGGNKPKRNGNYVLEVEGNAGGRSGPATADESQEQAEWAAAGLEGSGITVVRSSGIDNGRELHRAMAIPEVVGGAGTTLFYRPEAAERGWSQVVDKLLHEFVEAEAQD